MAVRDSKESIAAYMHIYRRKRYKRIMREIIDFLGGNCIVCNSTEHLQIDHKNRLTKKFSISTGIEEVSSKELWREVKKCQLLCEKHHDEKTAKEFLSKHGTKGRYRSRRFPCRCELCKNAFNVWRRNNRKRRKKLGLEVW